MRRRLLALDLALLALCGLAGWRLWANAKAADAAQARFLAARVPVPKPPVLVLAPPLGQLSAANYLEVAQKLLMSRDRNPTVIIDVTPPKVMPPFPKFYGAMNLGDGLRVLMATANIPQKSYVLGDTIGEFKLVEVTQAGVVFEWDGKKVAAKYDEMRDQTPVQESTTAQAAAPPSQTTSNKSLSTISSPGESGKPGTDAGGDYKSCTPGDTAPSGTISDGFRKQVIETPFGKSCNWVKVK